MAINFAFEWVIVADAKMTNVSAISYTISYIIESLSFRSLSKC